MAGALNLVLVVVVLLDLLFSVALGLLLVNKVETLGFNQLVNLLVKELVRPLFQHLFISLEYIHQQQQRQQTIA